MEKKVTRKFLGVLDTSKPIENRNFHNKHLKAYLKGKSQFRHGFDINKQPIYYKVLQRVTSE